MRTDRYQQKRQAVLGKSILGIDPGKAKHHGAILDASGAQQGTSFGFSVSREGFDHTLWKQIQKRLDAYRPEDLVIAVETSCNLWKTIAHYCHEKGYTVALVKPLTTYHSRSLMKHDFSRTDPKDAFLIADNTQKGHYDVFQVFNPHLEAMHQLSITYDKLWKDRVKAKLRLRSFMETYFPEYLSAFAIDTKTSLYLLGKYFLPRHFLELDIEEEAPVLLRSSMRHHGRETLVDLRAWAKTSIGVPACQVKEDALRIVLDGWVEDLQGVEDQIKRVEKALIGLAKQDPCFDILTSIPNISQNLAAQFIAETLGPDRFDHFKQIEKLAGLNLRLSQSGKYAGRRRVAKIGNTRLRRILYQMTQLTAKTVPQVRCKFLRRQLKRKCYRKSIIASTPQLLRLIVSLIQEGRCYQHKTDWNRELRKLEKAYDKQEKTSPKPTYKNSHIRRQKLVEQNRAA
jgi:transposase